MNISGCYRIATCLAFGVCLSACTKHWSASNFSEALRKGDVAGVRAALDQGFSANTYLDDTWTPLHTVLDVFQSPNLPDSTRVAIITLLLDHGADPNMMSRVSGGATQLTPLHFAAVYGPTVAAERLVAAGADVKAKSTSGVTPLGYAIMASRLEIVRLLLDHGANPNVNELTARDHNRMTPLHLAARGQPTVDKDLKQHYRSTPEQAEIIKLLLAKGADPSIRDGNGRTAFELAELNGQEEAIPLLKAAK